MNDAVSMTEHEAVKAELTAARRQLAEREGLRKILTLALRNGVKARDWVSGTGKITFHEDGDKHYPIEPPAEVLPVLEEIAHEALAKQGAAP